VEVPGEIRRDSEAADVASGGEEPTVIDVPLRANTDDGIGPALVGGSLVTALQDRTIRCGLQIERNRIIADAGIEIDKALRRLGDPVEDDEFPEELFEIKVNVGLERPGKRA